MVLIFIYLFFLYPCIFFNLYLFLFYVFTFMLLAPFTTCPTVIHHVLQHTKQSCHRTHTHTILNDKESPGSDIATQNHECPESPLLFTGLEFKVFCFFPLKRMFARGDSATQRGSVAQLYTCARARLVSAPGDALRRGCFNFNVSSRWFYMISNSKSGWIDLKQSSCPGMCLSMFCIVFYILAPTGTE